MEEKKTEIECCSEECVHEDLLKICLLYTSDAADEL